MPPRTLQQELGSGWRSEGVSENNEEWKSLATELIQQYVERIQGSMLEKKACAISWNYREVGGEIDIDRVLWILCGKCTKTHLMCYTEYINYMILYVILCNTPTNANCIYKSPDYMYL